MPAVVPYITGISEIQRKGKKALAPVFKKRGQTDPVFISDYGKISAVVLNIDEYKQLKEVQKRDPGLQQEIRSESSPRKNKWAVWAEKMSKESPFEGKSEEMIRIVKDQFDDFSLDETKSNTSLKKKLDDESIFWLKAAESSLDFWDHPSNDAYEKLL